jgi:hypothetical protein
MSTQLRFDLEGLTSAIESGAERYQLALYADDAQVQIFDCESSGQPPRVLQGKEAIGAWIREWHAHGESPRVTNPEVGPGCVNMVEELRKPDGTNVRFECVAEVSRGQIVKETVTMMAEPFTQGRDSDYGAVADSDPATKPQPRNATDEPALSDGLASPRFRYNLPPSIFLG